MRRNSFFTIIVVPDAQANYKKFSISRKKMEDFGFVAKKLKLMAGITQPADAFMENPGVGGMGSSEMTGMPQSKTMQEITSLKNSSNQLSQNFKLLEQSFQKQYLL